MNRREFIKNGILTGTAALILPEIIINNARAYWQDGTDEAVHIRETYLKFGSLESRRVTDAIVVHHIGNTNRDVSAEEVHQWHLNNGWSGIGYHYLIRKDGTIERGRPRDMVGAHCYGENWHTVGINVVGNFEAAVPEDAQITSLVRLLNELCQIYGIRPGKSTIFGHRDFNQTLCPGQNLYDMLPDVITRTRTLYGI